FFHLFSHRSKSTEAAVAPVSEHCSRSAEAEDHLEKNCINLRARTIWRGLEDLLLFDSGSRRVTRRGLEIVASRGSLLPLLRGSNAPQGCSASAACSQVA